ncbi:lecithin:cholesterol acyltransferase [Sphaerotilus hippei]|uniref:Lecithin:cholesterol acyltransferase n=1 Tax=Sphaerotilus hippei TaxID=744406 RepID=A0A318GV58_9BURK|nr:CHAT domain-containing protein [Sphaerotilus hippei]PXW92403.1 lecithin:cholesterol acyltransferase [Sphaerotilus hippei]
MSATVVLSLHASAVTQEAAAGWSADHYTLAGAARGEGDEPTRLELPADGVLELVLDNGVQLLVAAEDASRYLGPATSRGADAPATLTVGPALRLAGPHALAGTRRDGLGTWALKALKVYRTGPVGVTAVLAAGAFQDSQLDHRLGLHRLPTERWAPEPVEALPAQAGPVLLFLHGTASSCEGSFRALWGGGKSELDARDTLRRLYGDRIYGYEHRSLTEGPIANVLDLIRRLPRGTCLHLVSHSRGGLLGELLARAQRVGAAPFTEEDIDRFLQHAQRTGRQGAEQDADRLRALGLEMKQRGLRVERFVRVAATARGTTLASGRLDRWATVMLNLLGAGLGAVPGLQPIARGGDLLKSLALALVRARTDARLLPGLEAMMPDSPLVALLNAPDVELDASLHVIAGDFEGEGLLSWLGDCLSESYYGGETDLVVNTPSMSGGAVRLQGLWLKALAGPAVHHLSYFRRADSVRPLLAALAGDSSGFERLAAPSRTPLARGGVHIRPRDTAPIALLLPGIMGSHLARGRNRIWFEPFSMAAGQMEQLQVDATEVQTDGWMDASYERFAQHLAQTHELRPFTYDWRLSIVDAAQRFGAVLDQAMDDARLRRQPLRIVAHSMGGLVARLALKGRWDRFKAVEGSRLVQFGTPNGGSHSMAAVLLGRDAFVQKIERWADWKHDMREFLAIVSAFPGVLELLPWPVKPVPGGAGEVAIDGCDYFSHAQWLAWHAQDAENRQAGRSRGADLDFDRARGAGDGWVVPDERRLQQARAAVQQIQAAPLDPECTLYVGGKERTPMAIRLVDGQVEIGWSGQGDGRVPWETGRPEALRAWFVEAAHGDLLDHEVAFDDYVRLIDTGQCRLPTSLGAARDAGALQFSPAPLAVHTLYPSADEVLAAAVGGRMPGRRVARRRSEPVEVTIVHGSLACADTPVLIGAYANDPLSGSALFLDQHLGDGLKRAQAMGRYPSVPGDAMVFLPPLEGSRPGGAIVVGLGALGELQPGELTRALCSGVLEYARVWAQGHPPERDEVRAIGLSTLLVGTGYAGLSVELGVRALVEALRRANLMLRQAKMAVRLGALTLFEDEESRVIAAAGALRELALDGKFSDDLRFDGRIHLGQGRYLGRRGDGGGANGWQRVHITERPGLGLRFTLVTDRARNEVNEEPDQRQAVDGLIRSATLSTQDQPGLSRALFELMVPNGFKAALPDLRGLILGVDAVAAAYPWEMMRDEAGQHEQPLATRVGLVRQLASPYGRRQVATVDECRVLVVGDTRSGLVELDGARQEAVEVARRFQDKAYAVTRLDRPEGQAVLVSLFDGCYRAIHLAAHGVVAQGEQRFTGVVLGPDTYLTAAQVSKLRRVPEVVFLNCCHLGNMQGEAQRWGQLAANLATEFIEMGCKAVVAAGWAVDDAAAETFATTFWSALLDGANFGEAVLQARATTWRAHPASNTWGAYQAYGDERFRLKELQRDAWQAPDYLHAGQVLGDLDWLLARIGSVASPDQQRYQVRLARIEEAARTRFFHLAPVRERLAQAWADLGDKARAIEHYRAALSCNEAAASLKAIEQLANLEVRLGDALGRQPQTAAEGARLLAAGHARLQALLLLGRTPERLALLGSYWKRAALASRRRGEDDTVQANLLEMIQACRSASELSLQLEGTRDHYPTLQTLDAAIVLAAQGDRSVLDALVAQRSAWLAEAVADGRRRYGEQRQFFHAQAKLEATRVDALWAMLDGPAGSGLDREPVRRRLVAAQQELLRRLGNAGQQDSIRSQLAWLIELLPSSGEHRKLRAALQKFRLALEAG